MFCFLIYRGYRLLFKIVFIQYLLTDHENHYKWREHFGLVWSGCRRPIESLQTKPLIFSFLFIYLFVEIPNTEPLDQISWYIVEFLILKSVIPYWPSRNLKLFFLFFGLLRGYLRSSSECSFLSDYFRTLGARLEWIWKRSQDGG